MTNTDTTTTAGKPSTNLVTGELVCGKAKHVLPYGVLVAIENGPTVLLHANELAGGTHANRRARLATLEQKIKAGTPEDVAVEVTAIRGPKAGAKGGRDRINVSEKAIQEREILTRIKVGTGTEPGTVLSGIVKELRAYGALVECTDSPANGYSMMLHASECFGDRNERDEFIRSLKVGQTIEGEVISLEDPADEKYDLRIGISLVAAARREMNAALGDTNRVYRGKAGKGAKGGILVEFGEMANPMVGILPSAEVPSATGFGDTVRVKIARVDGDTIVLTRKGIK